MSDEMRRCLEAKRVMDLQDIEVHRTRQGHWHAGHVRCTRACPAGDPRTIPVMQRAMQRAAYFPECSPWT